MLSKINLQIIKTYLLQKHGCDDISKSLEDRAWRMLFVHHCIESNDYDKIHGYETLLKLNSYDYKTSVLQIEEAKSKTNVVNDEQ